MNILIIGSYPPPYGGVSVFIQRLERCLRKNGHDVQIAFPERPSQKKTIENYESVPSVFHLLLKMLFSRYDVIHDTLSVHIWKSSIKLGILYLMILFFSRKKVFLEILTGAFPYEYARKGRLRRGLIRLILKRYPRIICDAEINYNFILSLGIPKNKVFYIHSLIPFDTSFEKHTLPDYITSFIESHTPLVTMTGWTFSRLYNFELVINAIAKLRGSYDRIGLIIIMSKEVMDNDYKREILDLITQKDMIRSIIFTQDLPEVLPVYQKSDVFVRATSIDANSVSIYEALYLGIPVVASDADLRPEGTIIFKDKNLGDLLEKLMIALESKGRSTAELKEYQTKIVVWANDNFNRRVKLYESHE